ncbi:MAG: efflux RND transporter periplasmic adaptor subunit [Candidatus Eisenbacteria bacterium]
MKRKHIVWAGGAVFLAILIWRIAVLIIGDGGGSPGGFARPPVAVEVDSVRIEPIEETRQLTGTIYPLYQYILAPKVSGRIIRLNKRIGDWVKRGEVIAKIDDGEYQQMVLESDANLRISYANMAETQSELELARQELERIESLEEKRIASLADLETARTRFDALESRIELAKAQVEQRQAALNSAKIRLSYTTLLASEPGFIGERFVDEGSMLAPSSPVVSVIGIDTVIVRTTVIERVYGLVRIDQSADIAVDAYPGRIFAGRVSRIAPMLEEASRVAKMEVEVVNDSLLLKPGMFCKVTLVLAEKASAQVVPTQAVVTRNGTNGVFVIGSGETAARFVPVELGITTPARTEVLTPRIEGLVISLGQHLLEDGSTVILPDRPGGQGGPEASKEMGQPAG